MCQVTGIDETFGAIHITADGQTVPAADKKAPGKKAAGKPDLLDLATNVYCTCSATRKVFKGFSFKLVAKEAATKNNIHRVQLQARHISQLQLADKKRWEIFLVSCSRTNKILVSIE